MKSPSNPSRRQIIKISALVLPVAALSATQAHGTEEMVAESDDLAVQLGYKQDATSVDIAKFPKRAGDDGAAQFCSNCQFYENAKKAAAPCIVFGGKKVSAKGWCNSYFKKA